MYEIEQSMSEMYSQLAESFMTNSLSSLIGLVGYILLAVGMYAIADRRGISKPWLAWIPFGQSWMLGSISDQYQYVALGRVKSKRKVLLVLEILITVLGVAICVVAFAAVWQLVMSASESLVYSEVDMEDKIMELGASLMGILLLTLIMLGLAIGFAIVKYMALYDLYHSCDPANATLYTVLSIFLGAFVLGLLVTLCRKKDAGMPPRCDQTYTQPGYLPPQGWQQPPQQNWQPPQPPVEPWQQDQQPQDPWNP